MKLFSLNFSKKEKMLLLFLIIVLAGLMYYQFVDRPVRKALEIYKAQEDDLSLELTTMQAKLAQVRRMRDEMADVTEDGTISEMGSYNNSKVEMEILNNILSEAPDYTVSFASVTRDGDQIRRNFTLTFKAGSYEVMEHILEALANCHYRCLVGDIRVSATRNADVTTGEINVSITATFYETMVGGTPDAGLPADAAAAN